MKEKINRVQELQLELIKNMGFNSFNGDKVVKDLIRYKELWEGVIMDREVGLSKKDIKRDFISCIDLIKLRDISDDYWNVDTLFILSSRKDDEKLELLAKSWDADEVDWLTKKELGDTHDIGESPTNKKILRVWWD